MKRILLLSIVLIYANFLFAQNVCKRTSIYFDVDKFNIESAGLKKIDSVCQSYKDSRLLIELYGYADSSATSDHNLTLAQKRISSVRTYIEKTYKIDLLIREKNFGEGSNTNVFTEQWMNRRVDIFIFPITNNNIALTSNTLNETIEVPLGYFEPCGVCASNVSIKAYYNDSSASEASIRFQSTAGDALITAGTVKLEHNPCNELKNKDTIIYKIKAQQFDPEMTVWEPYTIDGVVYWRDLRIQPGYDTATNSYIVATNLKMINIDKYRFCRCISDATYTVILPKEFKAVYSYTIKDGKVKLRTDNDTIPIRYKPELSLLSYGIIGNDVYYLDQKVEVLLKSIDSTLTSENYTVPFDLYKPIEYTGYNVKIKFSKSASIVAFGYYNSTYEEFISLNLANPRSIKLLKQAAEDTYSFAFIRGQHLYTFNVKDVVSTYNKKKKLYKIKLNYEDIERLIKLSSYNKTVESMEHFKR